MVGKIIIFGAGGHGRVCADVARAAGWTVAGFCDTALPVGEQVNGVPVLGAGPGDLGDAASAAELSVFIAIGDNEKRAQLAAEATELGFQLATIIHPSAILSETATINAGTVLMASVVVNANSRIGKGCIINTAASLDHDNELDDFVQISPGVRSAGTVTYGSSAFVGTGASIIPGMRIGSRAVVGAGSVVIRDVADGARVAGNPATPI